jgi:hypothetical protein
MSEEKIDTTTLLANLKKKADPEVPAPAQESMLAEEKLSPKSVSEYQQYIAARVSTCLITTTGKRINFINYQYYTKDPEIVSFLDKEISQGLKGFTKGKVLTAEELNPEAAKKRAIIDDFKASQEGREFGDSKNKSERTIALTSSQVASAS